MESVEVVQAAKDYVRKVYADERISRPRLEELTYDRDLAEWRVTIGFAFEISPHQTDSPALTPVARHVYGNRMYKVVHLCDGSGKVLSMTDRLLAPAT